jgi:cytochrome P450
VLRFMWGIVSRGALNPLGFWTSRNLIAEDGERHSSMRAIVNRGFTPRQIAALGAARARVVESASRRCAAASRSTWSADLAVPVPVTIIAELLGVPAEQHRDFKRWSDHAIAMTTGPDASSAARVATAWSPCSSSACDEEARARAARAAADDLISTILASRTATWRSTIREVIQFVLLLLVAGNETTTNLIGNLTNALLEHPDELRKVAAEPRRIPISSRRGCATTRRCRWCSARRRRTPRCAACGFRRAVRRGIPRLGEPRRAQFPDPDRLDVDRDARASRASASASTSASARRSRGSRRGSHSRRSCTSCSRLERSERDRARVDSFLVRGPKRLAVQRAA